MRRSVVVLALAQSAYALGQAPGSWLGRIRVDRPALLRNAKDALQRKLLSYAAGRLEAASVILVIEDGGSYRWHFDDGFAPDEEMMEGRWSMDRNALRLSRNVTGRPALKVQFNKARTQLTTNWHELPAVRITFSRS